MLASIAILAAEPPVGEAAPGEELVPWPPYVYGGIALCTLLLLLLLVTRLDLDR